MATQHPYPSLYIGGEVKIDTPEKYKALQERRRQPRHGWKGWKQSDFRDVTKDRKGRKQVMVIVGGKPKHHERSLINGFSPLMTRAFVPKWLFSKES